MLVAALCAAALLLLAAAPALATRFASPAGSGSACTSVAPCSLATAIEASGAGEEITVDPGTYEPAKMIETHVNHLYIHGVLTAARPVIKGSGEILRSVRTRLSYLDIEGGSSGSALSAAYEEVLERMLIRGTPSGSYLCQCYSATIRNSVMIAQPGSSSPAAGFISNGGEGQLELRNDTIVSESKGAAPIGLDHSGGNSISINAVNTIALNTAGGPGIALHGAATATMSHSYYSTPVVAEGGGSVVDAGGNLAAAPVLTAGFKEVPGSPTIDAGLDEEANGETDYEGHARLQGAHTDIGAFEYTPPPASSGIGTGAGAPKTPIVIKQFVPPLFLVGFAQAHAAWRLPPAHGKAKPSSGTTFTFTSSRAATATLTFVQAVKGRRGAHGCEAATRRNSRKHSCRLYASRGAITVPAAAGNNRVAFNGTIGRRRLAPGSYRVTLTALPASGAMAAGGTLGFTVLR